MKRKWIKAVATLCATVLFSQSFTAMGPLVVKAAASDLAGQANNFLDAGGYKTEPLGTVTSDYMNTYKDRADVLPQIENVYLTEEYKNTVVPVSGVPTSDWASSVVFDEFSESLYVHPMAFRATSVGMEMANPAVVDTTAPSGDGEPAVEALLEASSVELVMGGNGFTAEDARIAASTDWTYDISMKNAAGSSEILTTLAKGSPYAYYRFTNVTPTISLGGGATNLAIYMNDVDSNNIGVSVTNKTDGKTHYYGVYASSGATWAVGNNRLTATLPAGKEWITVAALPDGTKTTFDIYATYAANRISNTLVEWDYSEAESLVTTVYNFETTNMDTGVTGGDTIIALYPHQWRYATEESFAEYTYETIRGTMKTIIGTDYTTYMTYNGILAAMPTPTSEEGLGTLKNQISYWWDYYQNTCKGTYTEVGDWQYGGYDTYWMGKNFNKRADIIFMAEQIEDDSEEWKAIKEDVYTALKNDLQYWFNPADCYTVDANPYITGFFYYYDEFGTMIGYNSSYSSDSELNDHHFHYGYWVKAAAAVAQYYKNYRTEEEAETWEAEWGAMVYELISDYANPNRNGTSLNEQRTDNPINTDTRYPFLRNFDIYEGHSWASGVANYEYDAEGNLIDTLGGLAGGNNQESTSEAVNAWSSLILWGEAVEDDTIRDLGVYLYTTEVAAIEEYYFDMHDEVFTDAYEDAGGFDQQVVTRLFGGRYDHTAWWTEDPIEVTSIHMIPMTGSMLYFSKWPTKIVDTYNSIWGTQWTNYMATKNSIGGSLWLTSQDTHHDLLAEFYALSSQSNASYAMTDLWTINDINGATVIETGESRAHTYGFIQSIIEFGTPDYTVTGSQPMSMAFKDDAGNYTYVAQNFSDEEQKVYFSNGYVITVPANGSYAGGSSIKEDNPDLKGKVTYNVETYLQTIESVGQETKTYEEAVVSEGKSYAGEYTIEPEDIDGFTFDEDNAENVTTATLVEGEDGSVTYKLYYDRNTYNIDYNVGSGNNAEGNPTTYVYGTTASILDPSRSGYSFEGWFTDEVCTQEFTGITATTFGNITLYAKWLSENAANYTTQVYVQNKAQTGYELLTEEILIGEKGQTVSFTYTGDTTGLTLNNTKSVTSGTVVAGGSLVLKVYYDRNTYSISYGNMTNATNAPGNPDSYVYGVETYLVSPTKSGYTFAGWYTDESCTGGNEITSISATSTGAVAVYAKWTETPDDGGSVGDTNISEDIEVSYADGKATIKLSKSGITSGICFISKYADRESAISACENATNALPTFSIETFPGHEGLGMTVGTDEATATYTVAADQYIVFGFNVNGTVPTTFYYYQVGADTSTTYTVNHLLQNETLSGYVLDNEKSGAKTTTIGNTVTAEANSYEGYTFNEAISVTSGTASSDGGLVLNLYYDRVTYDITYNNMDGATNPNPATYAYGVGLALDTPTKAGNSFVGWYSDSACTIPITAISSSQTGPVTVYAKWEEGTAEKVSYTVQYWFQNTTLDGYVENTNAREEAIISAGTTVNAEQKAFTGYTVNTTKSTLSGTATEGLILTVYYDRESYSITYHNVEDATNENATSYTYGLGYTLTDPVKKGYSFAGWYTDEDLTTKVKAISTSQTGNVDLYAKWTEVNVSYTVSYYLQNTSLTGYTEMTSEEENLTAGEWSTVTAEEKEFTGFTLDKTITGTLASAEAVEGLQLKLFYNRNKYDISYKNVEDASNTNANYYTYGVGMKLKSPTRDGYAFDGWFTSADFAESSRVSYITTSQTGAVTLYAKWGECASLYTVKHYLQDVTLDGYTLADTVTIYDEWGTTVEAELNDYHGFSCNAEADGSALSGVITADDSLVLSVYYDRNVYNINYENMAGANYSVEPVKEYTYGIGVTLPDAYKTGYSFKGWYTDKNFEETTKLSSLSGSSAVDITLYAKWVPVDATYQVKHYLQNTDRNGYYEVLADTKEYQAETDASVTAEVNTYTGFTYNAGKSTATGKVDVNNSLVLKLYYDRDVYDVTYVNMESATNPNAATYYYGVEFPLENPTKAGSSFAGWYTDEACTDANRITEIAVGATGAKTIYAKWIDEATSATYTVEYYLQDTDLENYSLSTSLTMNGTKGETVQAPIKEFTGFVRNSMISGYKDYGTVADDDSLVLKIYYDRLSYDVTYHYAEEGTVTNNNPIKYYYGVGLVLEEPYREDYAFDGWYTSEAMTKDALIEEISVSSVGTVELWAKWTSKYALGWSAEAVPDQEYTGKKITPTVVVRDVETGHKLQPKKDYSVKYSNNVNAGTATIEINGKGNYTGSRYLTFEILPIDLSENESVYAEDIYKFTNNGKAVKITPVLKLGSKKLKLNKEYKIDTSYEGSQSSYTAEGKYKLWLTGMGNYTGSVKADVVMTNKANTVLITKAKINGYVKSVPYVEGTEEYLQNLTLTYNGVDLVEGTHYELEYLNNKQVGKASVIVKGLVNDTDLDFTGSKTFAFSITGQKLAAKNVIVDSAPVVYRGYAMEPAVTVVDKNNIPVDESQYTVTYSNNVDKGKGTVTVTGRDGWEGTAKKTFAIAALPITDASVSVTTDSNAEYSKQGATVNVTVTHNGDLLSENVDYKLTYKNNKALGSASVTIAGMGNYGGQLTKSFTIDEKSIENATVLATDINYKANQKMKYYLAKPTVIDSDGSALSAGKEYNKVFTYEILAADGTSTVITDKSDASVITPGTVIRVTVYGAGPYTKSTYTTYRVIDASASIKAARISIKPQNYTGSAVTISKADIIKVEVKKNGSYVALDPENYEIVEGSYKNNVKKGNAKVTIRGIGEYGGSKEATFKIQSRNMSNTNVFVRIFEWLFG